MAELSGINDVMGRLSSALDNLPGLTAQGFENIVLDIGARAKAKAPVELGALRDSMETSVTIGEDEIIGEISFNETYAAYQHEHVELRHPQGGEAKYLEKAALEKYDVIAEKVSAALSALFGGGD